SRNRKSRRRKNFLLGWSIPKRYEHPRYTCYGIKCFGKLPTLSSHRLEKPRCTYVRKLASFGSKNCFESIRNSSKISHPRHDEFLDGSYLGRIDGCFERRRC